jgi:YesN/AraC family two-component response regulator
MRRKNKAVLAEKAGEEEADASSLPETKEGCKTDNLMDDINILMNKQQLFLNNNLKVNDVAIELNTNPRYVSDCIKAQCGCTFSQYVNNLRIEYAKNLMRNQPDIKMAEVALSAGFSNETTFFRTFKGITGQSPKEWMNSPET